MEGSPDVPLTDVESALLALDEVEQVHDLHAWTPRLA